MKKLQFPLKVYVDDNFRENYLKSQNWRKQPVKAVILDDNPLSIACYMEDHPEIDFDDSSDLNFEQKEKLKKMLKELDIKEMENLSAQDLIDSAGRRI